MLAGPVNYGKAVGLVGRSDELKDRPRDPPRTCTYVILPSRAHYGQKDGNRPEQRGTTQGRRHRQVTSPGIAKGNSLQPPARGP